MPILLFLPIGDDNLSSLRLGNYLWENQNNQITDGEEYYRVENLSNPTFTKLDATKAAAFISGIESRFEEKKKLKQKVVFPKYFNMSDMGVEVYAIKLSYSDYFKKMMMSTAYINTKMMDPKSDSYNPTRAGDIVGASSSLPRNGDELRAGKTDGFVIVKVKDLNAGNTKQKLTEWVKNNLDGIFNQSSPKLKISVSENNQLSLCLGMGKIQTFNEEGGKLKKVRTLDLNGELVAFTRGSGNNYNIITSDGKSDNTNLHSFKSANDGISTKNIKLWDKHRQDKLKDRPYPTFDYANGEYLLQYYLHLWEESMNTNLHSASFRVKIDGSGTATPRKWQTSHTFGMDALHNGTDWVSLYSTDGDFYLNHPGVFIDKIDKKQKALLFSSPQRWAEKGQGDAAHGQMNYFYTGLGGIAYDGSGYGAVLNNPKMTTAPTSLPLNVGYVYVKDDFTSTPRRNNGDQSLVDPTANLQNDGAADQVTIYSEKMNTEPVPYKRKVKWLSNYNSIEDGFVNNTDIVAIGDKFIVVWEKWAKVGEEQDWGEMVPVWDHVSTEAVLIDKKGNILKTKSLGKQPLNNWDDLKVRNGKAVWATFDDTNLSISIHTLDANLNHSSTKHAAYGEGTSSGSVTSSEPTNSNPKVTGNGSEKPTTNKPKVEKPTVEKPAVERPKVEIPNQEVKVSNVGNIALNKKTRQSSDYNNLGLSDKAVDGKVNTIWLYTPQNTITHTKGEKSPWWEVDLGANYDISEIKIYNRTDKCCWDRLTKFHVMVSEQPIKANSKNSSLFVSNFNQPYSFTSVEHPGMFIKSKGKNTGRYIRIFLDDIGNERPLSLTEVQVFGEPAKAVSSESLFDENKYYRLTTKWQGPGKSLDILNNGKNNQPILSATGNYTGQMWKIKNLGNNTYQLSTQWQGDNKVLSCPQGANENRPMLENSGSAGSTWYIKSIGGGYYQITNGRLTDKSLDIINDGKNNQIQVAKTGSYTGQMWQITAFSGGSSSNKNSMKAGETLNTGQRLVSANGAYIMVMQTDGHLCVYQFANGKQGRFVWGSGKYGFNNAKLTLQTDGNLVVYDARNEAKWSSETHPYFNPQFRNTRNRPVKLVLEDNGKVQLYNSDNQVVWTSK